MRRSAISRPHRPLSPAPWSIRSTLYCVAVTPYGLSASFCSCSRIVAVRSIDNSASAPVLGNGLLCLISSFRLIDMSEDTCYNTHCQEGGKYREYPSLRAVRDPVSYTHLRAHET